MTPEGWGRRWRGRYHFTTPPPDPPGAEDAELIFVGYRTWLVGPGPRLLSPSGGTWEPGAPMVAGQGYGRGIYAHTSLGSCTAYRPFARQLESVAHVHGAVALWGNVRGGAGGERVADFGYPLTLDIAVGLEGDELHALRDTYGIPSGSAG